MDMNEHIKASLRAVLENPDVTFTAFAVENNAKVEDGKVVLGEPMLCKMTVEYARGPADSTEDPR